MTSVTLIIFLLSYLLGSLSWSYIISKLIWKEDIRQKGSGNSGASNMIINHGWKYGAIVFLLDFFKTFLATKLIYLFEVSKNYSQDKILIVSAVAGFISILGHIYPFWLNFKGGKGTASALGLAFALDWKLGLIGIISIVVVTLVTNYIAIGGMTTWLFLAIGSWILFKSTIISSLFILMMLISIFLHRKNIRRIKQGTENGLKRKYDDKDKELMK